MRRKRKGFKFKQLFPPQPHDDNKANQDIKEPITKDAIKKSLADVDDFVMKEIKIGDKTVTIVYLNTIVETSIIDELVFNPLNQSTSTKADEIFKNYTTQLLARNMFVSFNRSSCLRLRLHHLLLAFFLL
ncbi:hypothetical protein [Halalkalibacter flavus]|uniref:hypothetical protein n=1 Tax=Halalkalibacter flavus TaxID=3090668 RepID=UPI002FCA76B0